MNYTKLQADVENYIREYFHSHANMKLVYHDLDHTKRVVKATQLIANHYQLNDEDYFIVTAAAFFHDAGYFTDPLSHELTGAELARQYLQTIQVPVEIGDKVARAIIATGVPQKPENLIESILCDGDMFHLGSKDFRERSKLMHEEIELLFDKKISKSDWRQHDISFLEDHHYHTDYAQLLLKDQKRINLEKLKRKLEDKMDSESIHQPEVQTSRSSFNKNERPDRGIETMFRITSTNNQRLSDMADNKAQILITVNSIILSLIVSLLITKLENNAFLIIPSFMLLMVSLACVVVSIISTRPSIPKGIFNENEIAGKTVNLLFFGNFYKMALKEYTEGMLVVMNDKEFLYGTLIKDVYSQGVVLGKKYILIRLAYNIFMFGLVASTLGFFIAYLSFNKI